MSLMDAKITDAMINDHFRFDMYEAPIVKRCVLCNAELNSLKDNREYELCADCTRLIRNNFKVFVKACMESADFDETADVITDYASNFLCVKSAYSDDEKRS